MTPKIVRAPLKEYERYLLNRALDLFEDSYTPVPNGPIPLHFDKMVDDIRKLRKKIARYEKIARKKPGRKV